MNSLVYEFDKFQCQTDENYIFQLVQGRKLSDIYHSHDFYEVHFILDGNCTAIINEKEISLDQHNFFILRPNDRHLFNDQSEQLQLLGLSVKKTEFEMLANVYNPSLLNAITQPLDPLIIKACPKAPVTNLIADISDVANGDCDYKLLLFCLMKLYLEAVPQQKSEIPKDLLYAMNEIKKREYLKGGVKAFTELSNYSQSHLTRLMKKYFHTTIHAYILNLRLEAAYHDFLLTPIRPEEICEEIGFKSFSHFNKVFKEKYGITPAALRKTHWIWTT